MKSIFWLVMHNDFISSIILYYVPFQEYTWANVQCFVSYMRALASCNNHSKCLLSSTKHTYIHTETNTLHNCYYASHGQRIYYLVFSIPEVCLMLIWMGKPEYYAQKVTLFSSSPLCNTLVIGNPAYWQHCLLTTQFD